MRPDRRASRDGRGSDLAVALASAVAALALLAHAARAQRVEEPTEDARPAFACPLAPAPGGLPDGTTPSRLDVIVAMGPITPHIVECVPWTHGEVQWQLIFRGFDGAPVEARLVEASAPSPTDRELRCMEVAACAARVPPFTRDTFTVSFPFRY